MARTEQEILQSYQESAKLSDETVDVAKGPLYSLVGRPLAKTLEPVEQEVERLEKIYSSEFAAVATEPEAQAFINNWGEAAGVGTPAQVPVYFMMFRRPRIDEIVTVSVGSLVSNSDRSLQYVTTEAGQIRGDNADAYYNSSRRTYEVRLNCQAVANGADYDLPAGRIIAKLSPLPGIDAVENRQATTPGTAAETTSQQIVRIREKFKGLAVNTANGAYTRIRRYQPTVITDVKTVTPTDRELFQRIVYGPAADHYMVGQIQTSINESYTSVTGGETEIAIQNVPAKSISDVAVNGVPLTNFMLKLDTSEETRFSAIAQDKLLLGIPLIANDVVTYTVQYNSLIQSVQNDLFGEEKLFNTNELAREFVQMPIRIELTGRALASYDPIDVENRIRDVIESLIPKTTHQDTFYPNDFYQEIQKKVLGLTNLQLIRFQRSTLADQDVEIVVVNNNEIATYDATFVTVQIRTV